MPKPRNWGVETGAALLVTLFALSLFSILGLYITLNANTGLIISDNYESQIQATYASLAGLNHARALLCGLILDDVLNGPDGSHGGDLAYLSEARSYRYRMPLPLRIARAINIQDPLPDLDDVPDDGLLNTGFYGGASGTALIPLTGIGLTAPDPNSSGEMLMSRYFVKVADNNGEASEIAADSDNDPFVDGDGIIVIRSLGIARTLSPSSGSMSPHNSVAVFEARLKRLSTWDLGSALIVIGSEVYPDLGGAFEISGGIFPGMGTIDTTPEDSYSLDQTLREAAEGSGTISGGELPSPSIADITAQIRSNPDKSLLLNPRYLWKFIHDQVPKFADHYYEGSQSWSDGNAPDLGTYDDTKSANAPGQDPKVTMVNGDLQITGNISGGGLLIVTGDLVCSGSYSFNGLVLVIGSGNLTAAGTSSGIKGEIVLASLTNSGEELGFGSPGVFISGSSRFVSNRNAVKMAIGLIPASQIGFREIVGQDP